MKVPAIVRKVATLGLLLAINAASASVLTLSTSIAYPLASQTTCASDPGCQRQASLPVASAPGQIAGQEMAAASANRSSDSTAAFAAGHTVDDGLPSPADSQPRTFSDVPAYLTDAADEYTADQDFKWGVKLRLLQTYSSVRSLLSLIDIGEGNAEDAGKIVSSQYQDAGAASANARHAAAIALDANTLCVATNGSYNTVGAATQRDCPAGSIFVSTQRSASMAEYAAYAQSLSKSGTGASPHNASFSESLRYTRNDAAPRQYRRCNECDVDQTDVLEPGLPLRIVRWMKEPGPLLLLVALALVAALISDAAGRGRRA